MAYLSNGKRIPEFLIVHLPGQSSERLIIPDSFVTSCNRRMPKNAVLSNYIGSSWHVTLGCIDGRVFFLNGWQKFFKDNSIEYGDFLIFRYDGQRGFSVKILGTSGCEKRESSAKGTSYMNEVKLEGGEEEKEKEEETKENDNEDYDDHDHDSDNNDDSNGDNNDDSNDSDYIDEEEENSTEEEAIKKSRAGKQSGGSIGSKTRAAVNVEGGSKRINVVNIEEEEEESTIRKSRVRKQSGGNNGGSKKWTAVKVEGGSKRTNTVNIEEEEEEDESTIKTGRAQKRSGGNTGGSKKWTAVKVEGGSKRTNTVNIEEEEEEEEEESTIKTGRAQKRSGGNTGGYKKRVFVRIEEEKEVEEEESRDWENSDENNGISVKMLADKIGRGSTRTCDFPFEEVDVSKYIQPRNPHFIAKLRAGPKRNILPIPSKVINFWQLKLPNLVFFQNNCGRQWRGNVFSWKDGRFWISGWNDFCLGNRVSPNDCCICEFLPRNIRGEDIINVHIVPKTGSRS